MNMRRIIAALSLVASLAIASGCTIKTTAAKGSAAKSSNSGSGGSGSGNDGTVTPTPTASATASPTPSGTPTPTPTLTPPSVPLTLTGTAGDQSADLAWSASLTGSTPITYKIYRSTSVGTGYVLVTTVSGTTYTNSGLTNGTNYYFVVRASNAAGDSANSNEVNVRPGLMPGAPTALTVTNPSSGKAALAWTAPAVGSAPLTYKIYRSTTTGGPYTEIATGISPVSYADAGLTNNVTYYYTVKAVNFMGTGPASGEGSHFVDFVRTLAYDFTTGTLAPTVGSAALTLSTADDQGVATYHGIDGKLRYAAQNLFKYSEDFSNSLWDPSTVTRTANAADAPDGSHTAALIQATATSKGNALRQWQSYMNGTQFTISFHVKKVNHSYVGLQISYSNAGGAENVPYFNFDTETLTIPAALADRTTGRWTALSNSWYRIEMTYVTEASSPSGYADLILTDATGSFYYTPAGTEKVYVWGAQVEAGPRAGEYLKTTNTTRYDGARFDFHPTTHAARGLLIEQERVNRVYYSERLDQKECYGFTSGENSTVAPDGTKTADTIAGGKSVYYKTRMDNLAANSKFTRSVFIRKTSGATIFPGISVTFEDHSWSEGNEQGVVLNTNTGTAYGASGWAVAATNIRVEDEGDYWRVFFTVTSPADTMHGKLGLWPTFNSTGMDGTKDSTIAGTNSIVMWGEQFEDGEYASSYIANHYWFPITRHAPTIVASTSSWFGASSTIVATGSTYVNPLPAGGVQGLFSLSDGTAANAIECRLVDGTSSIARVASSLGGAAGSFATYAGVTANTTYKFALGVDASGAVARRGSGAVATGSGNPPASVTTLRIGATGEGANALNGWIRDLNYYDGAMSSSDITRFTP